MTPQELKNSILQLAIQGKLVEQRPEEGTGEELYRQIQVEKQKLIKEGKIKKEKPLSEITEDEKPFDIPKSWRWVRLGDCSSYGQIKGKITPDNITSDMWSLDLEDIEKETGRIIKYCCASERKIIGDKVKFYKGQILYSKLRPYLKKILVAPDNGICTPELVPFSAYGNMVPHYLALVLKAPHVDFIINSVTYGVKMPRVGTETMINLLIPLPPLAEQKRIVAKIEEILPLIDRYDKAWTKLEDFNKRFPADMQKSLLQMAIQGKLIEQRPEEGTGEELYRQIQAEKQELIKEGKIKKEKPLPEITEDEKPFDIPESWRWVRLGNVIALLSGTDFKPEEYNDKKLGIPYITGASSLSSSGVLVNRWTETPRVIANRGDLLLVCKGSGYGKVVTCDIDKAHIARQIMAIKYLEAMCMNYIRYFLQANIAHIKASGQGVIPGIDRSSVQNMFLPLPPLAEQKRIVAELDELLPLCEKLK